MLARWLQEGRVVTSSSYPGVLDQPSHCKYTDSIRPLFTCRTPRHGAAPVHSQGAIQMSRVQASMPCSLLPGDGAVGSIIGPVLTKARQLHEGHTNRGPLVRDQRQAGLLLTSLPPTIGMGAMVLRVVCWPVDQSPCQGRLAHD